jgi:hypothetical protein
VLSTSINTLIRIAFLTGGFWLVSAIGLVAVAGGFPAFLMLGAAGVAALSVGQLLFKRAAGIPACACPTGKGVMLKLVGGQFVVSCLVIAVAALTAPQITLSGWLAVIPAGFLLLVAAVLSNIPVRAVGRLLKQEDRLNRRLR